jgi:hypothetical protein
MNETPIIAQESVPTEPMELPPCPFCGAFPVLRKVGPRDKSEWRIECETSSPMCFNYATQGASEKEEIIRLWNTRKAPSVLERTEEHLVPPGKSKSGGGRP